MRHELKGEQEKRNPSSESLKADIPRGDRQSATSTSTAQPNPGENRNVVITSNVALTIRTPRKSIDAEPARESIGYDIKKATDARSYYNEPKTE